MANSINQEKFKAAEQPKPYQLSESAPVKENFEAEKAKEKPEQSQAAPRQTERGMPSKYRRTLKKLPVLPVRDEMAVKIEKIMEDGLHDAYHRLSPIAQQEFKLKGEETARKISELLKSTHVKMKKIFRLILDWLRMLPGINKFFLEQEAKIKTDRIIAIRK